MYAHFARVAGLRVPDVCLFQNGGFIYFGSEILEGRISLKNAQEIYRLCTGAGDNQEQLTRALLMDLALLNSDRTSNNTLCDLTGRLWFIDHDKSLWGEGSAQFPERTGGQAGNRGRLTVSKIEHALENFLGDYLCCYFSEATDLVFTVENWQRVLAVFDQLPLDLAILAAAHESLEDKTWLDEGIYEYMEDFLPAWWDQLRQFFHLKACAEILQNILQDQRKKRPRRA